METQENEATMSQQRFSQLLEQIDSTDISEDKEIMLSVEESSAFEEFVRSHSVSNHLLPWWLKTPNQSPALTQLQTMSLDIQEMPEPKINPQVL